MVEAPWLTIVGVGEDGPDGLPPASLRALESADIIIGPPRHLSLLPDLAAQRVEWPVPFSEGWPILEGFRGRPVVALVSGDPFWFGAGSVIAHKVDASEWRALPSPSAFSLAASRMGWPVERTLCLGLHATPVQRLRPHLAPGVRAILLLRDGNAVGTLARYLQSEGFAGSSVTVLEALGGPREKITTARADSLAGDFLHPLVVGVEIAGDGPVIPCASGIADTFFDNDGQITKRPIRALALSALAPRPSEVLWDIGGGSGSIGIEWCLAHPQTRAVSIEPRPDRVARLRSNADWFGLVDRLMVMEGSAPDALNSLPDPHAVFIGGGLCEALLVDLATRLPRRTRLVAHAVTLDSEALLSLWSARIGGDLLRIALAESSALGSRRAWSPSRPIVQWRVVL